MQQREMKKRRQSALGFLQEAINELGPISDVSRYAIRETILDLVDGIYDVGEELKGIRFDVYDRSGNIRP